MKIIIVGANQVGSALAETLSNEKNDITIVDENSERLHELNDHIDARVVAGPPSHPATLLNAGADDAEMLIAVTDSDEINMVACRVAHTVFKVHRRICRIRSSSYTENDKLFAPTAWRQTKSSSEEIVSGYISRLIELPGSLQVLDFADSRVQLVAVKAFTAAHSSDKKSG